MQKWFKKHRIVLIIFFILTIALLIMTTIQISYILQPHVMEDLNNYIKTKEIAPSLMKHVIMTIINLLIFGVWIILFAFIIWEIIFPTKKSIKEAFQVDSMKYLYNLPNEMKSELKRDE